MRTPLIILPFFLTAVSLADETAEVIELRETISKIVEVKAQTSQEWQEWQGRQEEMSELLKVHRKELTLLDEELGKSGTSAVGYDEKKRAAEEELQRLRQVRRVAGEAVIKYRGRMLTLATWFPEPLAKEIEPELLSLEAWENGDEVRDGLQAILGIITKAEQFNRRITRAKETREGREVEVIYLGLARAYYADRYGSAGLGVPGSDGWQWVTRNDLNSEVVKALDELDRKRPPELVRLPVKVEEVAK